MGDFLLVHSLFDVLALLAGLAAFRWVPMPAPANAPPWQRHPLYLPLASLGVTAGAYLLGSLNLWLTGVDGVARSIEGGLAGGILAVEALKAGTGIRGSTGLRLVAPLAAFLAVVVWLVRVVIRWNRVPKAPEPALPEQGGGWSWMAAV